MDLKFIKKLMKEFENSSLNKIEISEEQMTIKMEKPLNQDVVKQNHMVEEKEICDNINFKTDVLQVKSPLVGTFYNAPSPDSSPFVKVNQAVQEGDVLCIIEAMKVMNEIRSPFSGTIKRILVSNETMVEFGQVLIEIEKA